MADIEIERQHGLDFETARVKAKQLLQEANEKFGLDVEYAEGETEDVAKVSKSGVDATATLTGTTIRFEAKLGFMAKPFKGAITDMITKGMDEHLPS